MQHIVFGRRTIAWADVKDFYLTGSDIGVFGNIIAVDGQAIRFWTGIGDVEELQSEIARRATRSMTRTWRKKEERASGVNK